MRYLFGFICVLALAVTGCSETTGTDGSGGVGGDGGGGGNGAACIDNVCPCTEAGIRAAIEVGGEEPYTFDCARPTTVVTGAEIVIDSDVVLDGTGNLAIDAHGHHRVLWVNAGTVVELRNLTVTGGRTTSNMLVEHGAGIYNEGQLTLTNSLVTRNEAAASGGSGGGIFTLGSLTLRDSTVSENTTGLRQEDSLASPKSTPPTSGGGILSTVGATLALMNSTVAHNVAEHGGGIRSNGPLNLINSTVSGNSASEGGGISHSVGDATVTNSTISGNTAEYRGGGIYDIARDGTLTITHSTLWDNVAPEGSAFWGGGPVSIGSSLVQSECENRYSLHVRPGNIESPGDTCAFQLANVATDVLNLGPLQHNGGPTFTHLPGPDSVAIDFIDRRRCIDADGVPVVFDQRGVERPNGPSCDAGAVEAQSPCEGLGCDDENVCTWNRCDPVESTCSHPPVPDGEPCDFDGVPGVCAAGECVEDLCANDPCDDSNDCTDDQCDWVDGSCTNTPVEDGQRCFFDTGCGGCGGAPGGYCVDGVCEPDPCTGNPCDDDNPCTADNCTPPEGTCSYEKRSDGTLCMGLLGQCLGGVCDLFAICGEGRTLAETAVTAEGRLTCDTNTTPTAPLGITLKMAVLPLGAIEPGENDFSLQVEFGIDAETVDKVLSLGIPLARIESAAATIEATMGVSNPAPVSVQEDPVPCIQHFESGTPALFVGPAVAAPWTLDAGQTLELTVQQFEEDLVVWIFPSLYPFSLTTVEPGANCVWETNRPSVRFEVQP